jgi:hypothetical protein
VSITLAHQQTMTVQPAAPGAQVSKEANTKQLITLNLFFLVREVG